MTRIKSEGNIPTLPLIVTTYLQGIVPRLRVFSLEGRRSYLSDSNNTKILWSLTKIIKSNLFFKFFDTHLILPDNSIAILETAIFFRMIQSWTIPTLFLPLTHQLLILCLFPSFLYVVVPRSDKYIDVYKAYSSDIIPPRALHECASELSPIVSSPSRRTVTIPIHPTIDLFL